jgi:hypothetical protein
MKVKTAKKDEEWARQRKEILEKAKARGWSIELPVKRPSRKKKFRPVPTLAPDKRTDIQTIDLVRKGRDY